MCGKRLRFRFFAAAGIGNAPDSAAFDGLSIKQWAASLPLGHCILGDAACTLGNQLLIPCSGQSQKDDGNGIFNFHLPQLRIRIEMAFGRLSTKWRMLRRQIQGSLDNISTILEACARLHNFEVTKDQEDECTPVVEGQAPKPPRVENFNVDALEDFEDGADGFLPIIPDPLLAALLPDIPGTSGIRQAIRDGIVEKGHQRPAHNVKRNGAAIN